MEHDGDSDFSRGGRQARFTAGKGSFLGHFRHYGGEFRHSSPRVVNLLGSRIFALGIDCAFIFFLTADAVMG
jgi:hypothetical protein